MRKLNNGLFGFTPDNDNDDIQDVINSVAAEVERENKKIKDAFKNYIAPTPKPITTQDGSKIYVISGYFQLTETPYNDFMTILTNNQTTPIALSPGHGQHYTLYEATAKIATKNGKQILKLSKKKRIDDQNGLDAWGQVYPGGPNKKQILFGSRHEYNGNNFGELWFTDLNTAKSKFDDYVKNGYEYKF
jgi:hypothetical protein